MEKIFSHAWRGRRGEEMKQELNQLTMKESTVEEIQGQFIDDDQVGKLFKIPNLLFFHYFLLFFIIFYISFIFFLLYLKLKPLTV